MPVFTAVRATVAGVIPAALLLAACGSSSSGAAAASARPVPAADVCVQVADVLGNGPDPDFDPVGYAEAQFGPLGAVKAAKPGLQSALRQLSTAYQQEFTQGVTKQTKAAVEAGQRAVNSICPGAAS
jgi:hypothetical protein